MVSESARACGFRNAGKCEIKGVIATTHHFDVFWTAHWYPRSDMVAVLGETTGEFAAKHMMSQMLASEEGREVLKEKPRITSASIELDKLLRYPEGTFGRTYADFMAANVRLPARAGKGPPLSTRWHTGTAADTLGACCCLVVQRISPDTRAPVRFVDDPQLAYVIQR